MGEVYRARGTRRARDVAVTVLPGQLFSAPNLGQPLEREAKAVSKLSHPHICTLHDIGRQDGMYLGLDFRAGFGVPMSSFGDRGAQQRNPRGYRHWLLALGNSVTSQASVTWIRGCAGRGWWPTRDPSAADRCVNLSRIAVGPADGVALASSNVTTTCDVRHSPLGSGGSNIKPFAARIPMRWGISMSTEFCTNCKQSHPGRVCDYDDQGECAETLPQPETPAANSAPAKPAPVRPQPGINRG